MVEPESCFLPQVCQTWLEATAEQFVQNKLAAAGLEGRVKRLNVLSLVGPTQLGSEFPELPHNLGAFERSIFRAAFN